MALNLTFWDNQQNPVNTTVEQLFDALRNDDMKAGLMYEPCTMDDVLDGTEPSNALIMDAIIAQYAKLTAKMNIMQRVMSRSGVDVKDSEGKTVPLTVVGYQISDPFMRLGTANVVALFELSDGQTVSIYFHNPDTTPKKITPQDEVISFKWLLNKKDITIVVAPEKGKDIDVRQVALRIMKIAAKNSAAFARQNKNRKERLERVNALRTRVAEKEKILAQKLKKIDELQYLKAQEEVDQLLEDERLMDSELNASLYAELKALDRLSDREDELDNIYQARVVAVRNMLRDKGWKGESYKELSKEGYVLTETYHYSKSGTNMIGVTYSIPELNLSYTDELTDTPEAIAEMINEPVDKALKALRLSQVESDTEEDKLLIDEVEALINAGEVITLSQNEMEEKVKQVKNSLAYQNILTLQEKLAYMGIAYEPLGQRDYYIYRERISGWLDYYDLDMLKNTRSRLLKIQLDAFKQLPLEEKVGYGRHNLRTSINKEHWEQFYVLHPELSDLHIKNYAIYLVKLGGGEEKLNRRYEEKRLAQQEQPIVISGKEFGEFDTSTAEGKAALREKAFEYLKSLADNGDAVFCKALNANVEFTKSGAKKYKKFSGNPIKSKLAIKIKELIANGKIFKESEERYDQTEQENKLTYHYLKNNAFLDEQEYGVRIVIREDSSGHFHYDLQINDDGVAAILDGVNEINATLLPVTKRGLCGIKGSPARLTMENGRSGSVNKADFFCHSPQETGSFGANKSPVSSLSQAQSELQPDNTAILNGKQVKNSLNPLLLDDTQQANLMIALNYAATLDDGLVIDATQLAQDQLEAALSVLENNLPINEQEGNIAQAELEREHIASIKEALSVSQSQPALDGIDDDGYVLNLFVEYKDENGNWVELKDEDEEVEPENSNAQPETIQSTPVLLHTSLLYKGEGYRPFLPGRDEEIEQFKQAGYMLEPFSVEGRSCTYSVHKTAEPYNIHITANWYSDGEKSYWINVSPQKGYVTDVKENNGGQAKVAGANENAKSVTDAIQLAEELIQEEKHYRPLRKEKGYISGTYFATKGRSKTYFFYVSQNLETLKYRAYIQWSSGEPKEMTFDSLTELKEGVENYFRAYVKGTLPEITLSSGTDILEINANKEDQETTVESEQSNAVGETLPELVLPENASRKELAEVVENWLKANLQGKIIKTVDNKTVAFNRSDSVKHLSFDGSRSVLAAKAATKVAEIFSTGQFIERQTLNKERNDKFVAFHLYEKTVEIDKNMVKIQAKAGEKLDGTLETLPNLLAYHHKVILDDGNKNAIIDFAGFIGTENRQEPPPPNNGMNDNTAILDDVQEEDLLATLIILEIRDKEGNLIDLDQLDEQEENEVEENAVNNAIELDEQKQADIQFLQDVIDCKIDVLADDFYNKLEPIATRVYDYNEELVSKAVDAYANKTDEYAIATE